MAGAGEFWLLLLDKLPPKSRKLASMQATEVRGRLRRLMAELFRCEESEITDQTGPGDLPGWDSLGHVSLMSEIQKVFGVHVPVEDALDVETFDGLVLIVERLLNEHA